MLKLMTEAVKKIAGSIKTKDKITAMKVGIIFEQTDGIWEARFVPEMYKTSDGQWKTLDLDMGPDGALRYSYKPEVIGE